MAIRTRVGQGFDIHRFVDGPSDRVLVLGGVKFPNEKPLAGHSDADVIAHAAADALLGAAALGGALGKNAVAGIDAICPARFSSINDA